MISVNSAKTTIASAQSSAEQTIELTPLIDVVFIVVVFLLLTANVRLLALPVTVPESDDIASLASDDRSTITITIEKDSQGWSIDQTYFGQWAEFREGLLNKLSASKQQLTVAIAADQQADVQRFVKVLTLLQQQQPLTTRIILQDEK